MVDTTANSHVLLNPQEFRDSFHAVGYDRAFGMRVFNLLAREGTWPRSSDSIAFYEDTRDFGLEWVISIPNLAKKRAELGDIQQLGTMGLQATLEVIDHYYPTQE